MITVTDSAVKHLHSLMADREDAGSQDGLRISIDRGGCSGLQYAMSFDQPKNGDEIVEREGVRVFVDAQSIAHLQGSVIDYHDDLTGSGFRIQNPNAVRTCGCGTSFEPAQSEAGAVPQGA
jgi:iron-sulfur cluster assembly accessory protein